MKYSGLAILCTVLFINAVVGAEIPRSKRHIGVAPLLISVDEALCHPAPTDGHPQYIIGYGNLIDQASKEKFYSESGESIPVRVAGFGRHWNFQKPVIGFGSTYLGAVIDETVTFNAVVFTIPGGDNVTATLVGHDERQPSFCRQKVEKDKLKALAKDAKPLEDGDYWLYVTRSAYSGLPNPTFPIVQSNVDVFVAGCIDIGKKHEIPEYAAECIQSTFGWEGTWVNDRIFPRRPYVHLPRANEIDTLLATNAPLGFGKILIE
jgi:hypothetical protein